jgi:hypothetical protein
MSATVHVLPGAAIAEPERPTLNLGPAELVEASGGYRRPADQLKALHERGFVRAFRRSGAGPVILERAHYDAVVRGQFGHHEPANDTATRGPLPPNRAGFKAKFGRKAGA